MFRIDREDVGENQKWFLNRCDETILLPGSMTTNGKGDEITLTTPWTGHIADSSYYKLDKYAPYREPDNIKVAAWLQPQKYYKGAAWYLKEVEITPEMAGKPLEINFERAHWETTAWMDGECLGMRNALGVPHRYRSKPLTAGKHLLAVRVDNRLKDINIGQNAHSISDHTQSNWNGLVGELFIETKPTIAIQNVRIYPDIDQKMARVVAVIENGTNSDQTVNLSFAAVSKFAPKLHVPAPQQMQWVAPKGVSECEITYPMGDFFLWDEFTPYLYGMEVKLNNATQQTLDRENYTFGMRKWAAEGRRFQINNRPAFLRGTLECAIFPKTGYPATDVPAWRRIFEICKAHGLNHVRFHSWCPPRAAFEAADQVGVYLQVEGGAWCSVGDGTPFDKWIYAESDRILEEYGNHPSFMLYTYGNEPDGGNQQRFLGDLVNHLKAKDSRHLYTSAAGWPVIEEYQYRNDGYPRLKLWAVDSPLNSGKPTYDYQFDSLIETTPVPWVSHEIGQWCVYPDFKEIDRYEDAVLQAKNFEIFRETLQQNGMEELGEPFLLASGKLQTLLYKAEIEAALRTKDFAGFQLLDLHDFPGQGTALVGVLNPFWDEKGYVTPEEYHQFASATVPLVRTDRFTYTNNETLRVPVEVAHFGAAPLVGVVPTWTLTRANGELYASGNLKKQDVAVGNCIALGVVEQPLNKSVKPEKLILTVRLAGNENRWDFWVYPTPQPVDVQEVLVTTKLDKATLKCLKEGGKVLLVAPKGSLADAAGGAIETGFSTIFWNSAWTVAEQPPLTLGLLNNVAHPALGLFPTEYHSNYQWANAVTDASVVDLGTLGITVDPIVRVIDDWFQNRSLGLIFEVNVGKGKLLFSGVDLLSDQANRPEARQLYTSLVEYMNSAAFVPQQTITEKTLQSLMK